MYLKKMQIYAGQKADKYTYRDLQDIPKALRCGRDEQFVGILMKGYQVTLQILILRENFQWW